jgi:hypothetical protein
MLLGADFPSRRYRRGVEGGAEPARRAPWRTVFELAAYLVPRPPARAPIPVPQPGMISVPMGAPESAPLAAPDFRSGGDRRFELALVWH